MVFAWPIPDTGQTKCYDNDSEIPCPNPGEAFYGQDSNYNMNPMSYTKLDGAGNELPDGEGSWAMVKDNATGLIWENKQNMDGFADYANSHDADNTYTWYDSNPATNGGDPGTPGNGTDTEDFIRALNNANFGGHNDWRIPTINELASIVDHSISEPGPTISTAFFPNTQGWPWYWSSTTSADNTSGAWGMSFYSGVDNGDDKLNPYYVRAVRGGQSRSLGHLVINGDGTVTDTDTGLLWQQATAPGTYTWEQALAYAESLTLAGYNDWRFPTIREQRSLADYKRYNPAIDTSAFPGTLASWYWSSTTDANYIDHARGMDFYGGYGYRSYKSSSSISYVRAVRGGQSGSLGHLVISSPTQASAWDIGAIMPIVWSTDGMGSNVKISISRQGGKVASFETIIASTANDSQYNWTVTGPASVNCVIKIEQTTDSSNWASQGLFVIEAPACPYDLDGDGDIDVIDIMMVAAHWGESCE